MTVFVDASAIVAMIAREPEAGHFSSRLFDGETSLTSAIAIWEACRGVTNARGVEFAEARTLVTDFIAAAGIAIVSIGADEGELALRAHELYGKGVHPAKLNMGDCFAYACTKAHDARILFKGDDFVKTDLKDAMLG